MQRKIFANAAIFAIVAEAAKLETQWWSGNNDSNPWGSFGSMFDDEPADKPAEKSNSDPFGFLSTGTSSKKKKKSGGLFDFGNFGFESDSSEPEVVAKP